MRNSLNMAIIALLGLFSTTQNAFAGIPIASWSIPYLVIGILLMIVFIGLTAVLKPKDVEIGYVSTANSPFIAVISRYLGVAAAMFGLSAAAWGMYDAIVNGMF